MKNLFLHSEHEKLGARFVNFHGWQMPVFYSGIVKEYQVVRSNAGIFDVSHMGKLFVSGKNAKQVLNTILSNDLNKLEDCQAQYTFLLNKNGGVLDDLLAYQINSNFFMLVVNAALLEKDFKFLKENISRQSNEILLQNFSYDYCGLAIQGANSMEIFKKISQKFNIKEPLEKKNQIICKNRKIFICATGYTGEVGFEIFCQNKVAHEIFHISIIAGALPCGLGARDILRLEMCYPLNGSDLLPNKTPLEADLGFFCALNKKENYIGKKYLLKQKKEGLKNKLCAIKIVEKSPPPRAGYEIFAGKKKIGLLSSAGISPKLGYGIGLAYLPSKHAIIGNKITVEIRNKNYCAQIVKKPFYRTSK